MRKLFTLLFTLLLSISLFCQYENYDNFIDTLVVRNEYCYLYKTNQTIYNVDAQTSLIKISKGDTITSSYFDGVYYKVMYENCVGYVFCMSVITPTRISAIQNLIITNKYTTQLVDSINSKFVAPSTYIENIKLIEKEKEYELSNDSYLQTTEKCNLDAVYYIFSFINLFIKI